MSVSFPLGQLWSTSASSRNILNRKKNRFGCTCAVDALVFIGVGRPEPQRQALGAETAVSVTSPGAVSVNGSRKNLSAHRWAFLDIKNDRSPLLDLGTAARKGTPAWVCWRDIVPAL